MIALFWNSYPVRVLRCWLLQWHVWPGSYCQCGADSDRTHQHCKRCNYATDPRRGR